MSNIAIQTFAKNFKQLSKPGVDPDQKNEAIGPSQENYEINNDLNVQITVEERGKLISK